jgi:hypothetical protein
LADAADGNRDDALAALTRAVQAFDHFGVAFEAARTREEAANLASPTDARALLLSALEGYARVGATPSAERVRVLLDRGVSGE